MTSRNVSSDNFSSFAAHSTAFNSTCSRLQSWSILSDSKLDSQHFSVLRSLPPGQRRYTFSSARYYPLNYTVTFHLSNCHTCYEAVTARQEHTYFEAARYGFVITFFSAWESFEYPSKIDLLEPWCPCSETSHFFIASRIMGCPFRTWFHSLISLTVSPLWYFAFYD